MPTSKDLQHTQESLWETLSQDFVARYGYEPKNFASLILTAIRMREFAAVCLYRLHVFLHHKKRVVPGFRFFLHHLLRSSFGLEIHPNAILRGGFVIHHVHVIVIGSGVRIGKNFHVYHNVTIGAKNMNELDSYPEIGDNVVVYTGSVLAGKIRIGDDVVVGANSLVLDDVPTQSIVYSQKSSQRQQFDL